MRRLFFVALMFALTACGGTQTSAQSPSAAAQQTADAVVGEIGGRKITMKELDEKWRAMDAQEQARITQLLYQNRRNALDQLMGDLLIEEAAKAAGVPPAQYLDQDAKKRAKPVTDADIKQFYEANKDRTQGRPFDELAPKAVDYLAGKNLEIEVGLGAGGSHTATVWTCDLSKEYVTINADYRT